MIENWKKQLGNGEKVGLIFMDFSKAFDDQSQFTTDKTKSIWFF